MNTDVDRSKLPYLELNMFTFTETLSVVTHEAVAATGMTLDQVADLLKSHGRRVKKVWRVPPSVYSSVTLEGMYLRYMYLRYMYLRYMY